MLCRKPYKKGVMSYGCGQCVPCRINRKRQWVARMMLEAGEHPYSAFVTLTYNEEHHPHNGCVDKRAVQLFMKRLRWEVRPRKIRFYAVGEYGEQSWRPHYHLMLFGISPTEESVIKKCWPFGFIQIGTAEGHSMQYICGYVVKKMTNPKDKRLQGRTPEFSVMSTRPGLGTGFVNRMSEAYRSRNGRAAIEEYGLTQGQVRLEGRMYPLGRYLKGKLDQQLGVPEEIKALRSSIRQLETYTKEVGQTHKQSDELRKSQISAQEGKSRQYKKGTL